MGADANRTARGFALAEMLVAMAIFLLVASAAFTLFNQHETIVIQQQSLSSVNIGLRNAMSQLEMDLAGAGQNLLNGVSVAGVPQVFGLGVILQNNVPGTAATCAANTSSWAYPTSSACFDALQIVAPKQCSGANAPVLAIADASDNMNTTTGIIANDAISPTSGTAATADAACFASGDEVLVLTPSGSAIIPFTMTVVTLSANSSAAGANVTLTHNHAGATGQAAGCPGSSCTDPLGLTIGNQGNNFSVELAASPYGSTQGSYLVDLGTGSNDIWYGVFANPSNSTDPQLMRCSGAACTAATGQVVADQVIGFKIGAALFPANTSTNTDIASYFFNSIKYCDSAISSTDCTPTPPPANDPSDFSLMQSVRISMIARTQPKTTQAFAQLKNGFDSGPYLIQQASMVVDLRNMSINNFGN
jgi:prepilin-type N-terminal cleavage/methylation domain-containing protein